MAERAISWVKGQSGMCIRYDRNGVVMEASGALAATMVRVHILQEA